MEIKEFINSAPVERRTILSAIHEVIVANDPTILPAIKPMMGKEMILYLDRGYMKYGLASTQKYMSLHCLPMYMNPVLYEEFQNLLPDAKFQKGCINFNDAATMPVKALAQVITTCSAISIADMLEKRKKK
ncbi:MAG: DUF1801 domain-containing protein [Mucilaginibacter sp.]